MCACGCEYELVIHQKVLQGQNLALQLWSTILYRFPAYKSQSEQFDMSALQNIELFEGLQ